MLAAHVSIIRYVPDRTELGERTVPVRYDPVRLDPAGIGGLRLAGAWSVRVADPRFGGLSALAVERDRLLALTDSGTVVVLPKPGTGRTATLRELPAGPGNPRFKRNRDSEALAPAPDGGWWLAFENRHSLWHFDRDFRNGRQVARLGGARWRANRGIEALAVVPGGLLLVREDGRQALRLRNRRLERAEFAGRPWPVADSAALPDGRLVLLERRATLAGFRNRLAWLDGSGSMLRVGWRTPVGVGRLDNLEGLATEARPSGTRLWLVSDNDFSGWRRTLLVALDLPRKP